MAHEANLCFKLPDNVSTMEGALIEPLALSLIHIYTELCRTLDIPIAATETTRGCHWGVAQVIAQHAADIVRADVSWKDRCV